MSVLFSEQEHLIENEVSILRRVKHPNIIMLIEEMDTPTELYLVMELVKVSLRRIFLANSLCGVESEKYLGTLRSWET